MKVYKSDENDIMKLGTIHPCSKETGHPLPWHPSDGELMVNKTSMLYWWPKVKDIGIPMPRTEIVLQKEIKDWFSILEKELNDADYELVKAKAEELNYPVFIRTDHSSAKHDYKDTCFVKSEKELSKNIRQLFEVNYCHNLYPEALILREYIELDWKFKAFMCLPIAPERRYFISNGEVVCHHPYWILDAIEFYSKDCPRPLYWQELLAEVNEESEEEITLLKGYSEKIASVLDGEFSVDFAKGKNGTWYFIDAASAIQSWHPEETETSGFKANP